jgi:DNA-binding response OmpR family regulator
MNKQKYPFSVLYIEDEKAIRENFIFYLEAFFDEVYEAEDGEIAYEIYKQKKPHILIIDVEIPKLNGIELLKKIRENDHTTRAIMLTSHSETKLLLEATSLKLTKYLLKPVNKHKLDEAISLVIKELSDFNTYSIKKVPLRDGYSWNYEFEELTKEGQVINLTNKEKQLFSLLMLNLGRVLSYENIIYEVWLNEEEGSLEALKTMIKNLRKKLQKDTIVNIFGVGYKIEK